MTTIIKIAKDFSISRIKCKLPDDITGIGYSQKEHSVLFYRSSDGVVGFIGNDDQISFANRRLEVNNPVGICCDPWGICVLQFTKDMIWNFDQSYCSGMRLCGAGVFGTMSKVFPKDVLNNAPYSMCRKSKTSIVVAAPWGNRLLVFNDSRVANAIGSGKKGFMSAGDTRSSMFSSPSGVCFDEGSKLMFVSDTGNSIVRVFHGNAESAFIGIPGMSGSTDGIGTLARMSCPAAIRANKGLVAVADGNTVRTFKVSNLDVTTPYMSSRCIVDLAMGGDAIYVLERDVK